LSAYGVCLARNACNGPTRSRAVALSLCELLAKTDPARYDRAALRWLQRFIDERLPPLTEVLLAASALAELRHGYRNTSVETLKRLPRHG